MNAIELVEKSQITTRPDMKSGDTIRVHVKVREEKSSFHWPSTSAVKSTRRPAESGSIRRTGCWS